METELPTREREWADLGPCIYVTVVQLGLHVELLTQEQGLSLNTLPLP